MEHDEPVITVRGLGLRTRRGWVYSDFDMTARQGVTALLGSTGSGKTALLLSLAGRMRFTEGSASVAGHDLRRDRSSVSRSVGLGLIAGVNDLDDALTAGAHVREALLIRGSRRHTCESVLERVGLRGVAGTAVRDLDVEQREMLGIALGLIGEPDVLVVDDIDHDLDIGQQQRLMALLKEIAGQGVTVVAACINEHTASLADAVVRLTPPSPEDLREVRDEVA